MITAPRAKRPGAAIAADTLSLALVTLAVSWWLGLEQILPGLVILVGAWRLARQGDLAWPREAWFYLLFCLWSVASATALNGASSWLLWLRGEVHLVVALAGFLVAARVEPRSREFRRFLRACAGLLCVMAFLFVLLRMGLLQARFLSPLGLLWPHLGLSSDFVEGFIVERQLATPRGGSIVPGVWRQTSFFLYQGGLATALLVLQGWLLTGWAQFSARGRRAVAGALAIVFLLTLLTGSRSGVLLVVAMMLLLAFWRAIAGRPWRRWAVRGLVAAALLATLAVVIPLGDPGDLRSGALWEKVLIDFRVKSFLDRSEVYVKTVERLAERPWTGWGVQGKPHDTVRYLRLGTHSEVLNVAYRFGWPGLVFFALAAFSYAGWLARAGRGRPERAIYALTGGALAATALVRDLSWDLNVLWLVAAFLGTGRAMLERESGVPEARRLGPSFSLLGARLHALSIDDLHREMAAAIAAGERRVIGHQNLHGLYLLSREPAMREFARRADWVFLDGMSLVWMARRLGHAVERRHRVTYADWVEPLMAECARRGWRVFHLGGKPGVGERAAERLRARHPGLELETRPGYFEPADEPRILAAIAERQPDVLLVGMGMPRQEAWVAANLDKIEARVILTCGACMDYVAGAIPTPPRWLGRLGLEWLYRLAAEPRRLGKRYLVEPWPVLWRFLGEWRRSR